jgi:hypothetical protein
MLSPRYSGVGAAPALLRKRRVVELGAGPGLPGIVAALCGARVVLTDMQPTLNEICAPNAEANQRGVKAASKGGGGGSVTVAELMWGEDVGPDVSASGMAVDVVLGADVVFDEEHFPLLLHTLKQLLPLPAGGLAQPPLDAVNGAQPPPADAKRKKGKKKSKTARQECVPFALFAYRERKRCARHGCDTAAFFELLATEGYVVSDVDLARGSQAGAIAEEAAQVAPKTKQLIRLKRVSVVVG